MNLSEISRQKLECFRNYSGLRLKRELKALKMLQAQIIQNKMKKG